MGLDEQEISEGWEAGEAGARKEKRKEVCASRRVYRRTCRSAIFERRIRKENWVGKVSTYSAILRKFAQVDGSPPVPHLGGFRIPQKRAVTGTPPPEPLTGCILGECGLGGPRGTVAGLSVSSAFSSGRFLWPPQYLRL